MSDNQTRLSILQKLNTRKNPKQVDSTGSIARLPDDTETILLVHGINGKW